MHSRESWPSGLGPDGQTQEISDVQYHERPRVKQMAFLEAKSYLETQNLVSYATGEQLDG